MTYSATGHNHSHRRITSPHSIVCSLIHSFFFIQTPFICLKLFTGNQVWNDVDALLLVCMPHLVLNEQIKKILEQWSISMMERWNNVHHNWGNKYLLGGLEGKKSEEMRRWQNSGDDSGGTPFRAILHHYYPMDFSTHSCLNKWCYHCCFIDRKP